MEVVQKIFLHVQQTRPETYLAILDTIRPHYIESLIYHFSRHLKACVSDLNIFNDRFDDDGIARLLLSYAKSVQKKFPSPGEAFGIQLTCRITQFNTQGILDSKHLKQKKDCDIEGQYNVSKSFKFDLEIFSTTSTIFEMSKKKAYSFVVVQKEDTKRLIRKIGQDNRLCFLKRGLPYNKAIDTNDNIVSLDTFNYIHVFDGNGGRIFFKNNDDLFVLLKRLDDIVAVSDVRYVFEKCGIVGFYLNFVKLIRRLYVKPDDKDVYTIVKYMCRSGMPLPLSRNGLAKQPERTPIEVIGFEAPKTNLSKFCTENKTTKVESSLDKIFFGQQFNEGTGYDGFALMSSN